MKHYFTLFLAATIFHPLYPHNIMELLKEFYCNKKVVVTGGAGFIGSYLTEQLVSLGAHVTVLDDLSTGNINNIDAVVYKINFLRGSITDLETCLAATKNCSIIFHCAALVSVPESIENPQKCHAINVNGTLNMLEAARINNCERFILSSSSAVYGPQDAPCIETMACAPTSPYGYSKYIGELYCQQYTQSFGLLTASARYFNVFGPRQRADSPYSGVIAKFQNQMRNNKPLTIFGDGKQTRDFIPVMEVVYANLILAALPANYLQGEAYNVATGASITLLELIEQLRKEFPRYKQAITFQPARVGDIKYSAANSTKLRIAAQSIFDNHHH